MRIKYLMSRANCAFKPTRKSTLRVFCRGTEFEITLKQRRKRLTLAVGRELVALPRLIFEWVMLGMGLKKKIEGIDHRHLGDQIDADAKFVGRLVKNQAG